MADSTERFLNILTVSELGKGMADLKQMKKKKCFPSQNNPTFLFYFELSTHIQQNIRLVKLSCLPHAGRDDWDVVLSMNNNVRSSLLCV